MIHYQASQKRHLLFSSHQLLLSEQCKNCKSYEGTVSYVFMPSCFNVENVEIASSVENVFCLKGMKRRHLFLSHLTLFRANNSCRTSFMPLGTSWPQLIAVKVGILTICRSQILWCGVDYESQSSLDPQQCTASFSISWQKTKQKSKCNKKEKKST